MKKLLTALLATTLLFSVVSCGKKTKEGQSEELSIANAYLNSKEYEKAIVVLEDAINKHPEARELKVKLAHAYAGAGGFEAIKFGRLVKELEETKLKGKVKELLAKIEEALSKVPSLSYKQKERLNQAIKLYSDLGLNPYSTSNENYFKWGVLHTYRLLVTTKESVTFIKEIVEDRTRYTEDEIQNFFISKGDLFAKDFYQSYQLFKNSFDKLKKIASKVENLIKNTIESDEFKLKIESKAKNYRQFVKDIIRDNKEIISGAIAKISDKVDLLNIEGSIKRISQIVENGGEKVVSDSKEIVESSSDKVEDEVEGVAVEESLKKIVKGFKDNKEDVDSRLERLEILARLFLDNVVLKYPQENEELKQIFNDDLRKEAEMAIDLAMEEKTFRPIKNFLDSKESSIQTVVKAWKILSAEYEKSEIQKIAEPDVRALLNYIDEEEAKRLKERAEKAAKEIEETVENGAEELKDVNKKTVEDTAEAVENEVDGKKTEVESTGEEIKEIVEDTADELKNNNDGKEEELKEMLKKDAKEIEADIKPHSEAVEEALESEDKEMEEKAPKIIKDVKEYIEEE